MASRVVLIVWASLAVAISCQAKVTTDPQASPRVQYGASKIEAAIKAAGIQGDRPILVGTSQDESIRKLAQAGLIKLDAAQPGHEGFILTTCSDGAVAVIGSDDSEMIVVPGPSGAEGKGRVACEARGLPCFGIDVVREQVAGLRPRSSQPERQADVVGC